MSDERVDSALHGEDSDPGEPIAELANFENDSSSGLLARVRRAIQRHTTAAQLTAFSSSVVLVVLREFWLMLVGQLDQPKVRKDTRNGEKTS
jgi:hypothetical protein